MYVFVRQARKMRFKSAETSANDPFFFSAGIFFLSFGGQQSLLNQNLHTELFTTNFTIILRSQKNLYGN